MRWVKFACLALPLLLSGFCSAQQIQSKPTKPSGSPPHFRWVNPFPEGKFPGLVHATFDSERVQEKIGYCIYLPPGYDEARNDDLRYPVVYYLHGGRPGNETKSIALTTSIDTAIRNRAVPAMIYVFVNGGAVSHYNYPQNDSPAEDILIHELIPHIDATYRTIAGREGRGLEGFSQGGRATARIGFAYPNVFCSAASGGGGHATEKRIAENDGRENATLRFQPGANSWDRARSYAASPHPPVDWLFYVGSKGFNYSNNLQYMEYLQSLDIPFRRMIVSDVHHSARLIYQQQAVAILNFHADNFGFSGPRRKPSARTKQKTTVVQSVVDRVERDIHYAQVGERSLSLDLYIPPVVEVAPSLVVWIHGGGWRGGSKKGCPVRWLTSHNYAVASLDFRLSDEARFPAQVHDCKGAIRWLRANAERFGCDGRRIAVIGGSSGGHLAALVGTTNGVRALEGNVGGNLGHSSRVQAIVDMYGMTDLFYNATVESTRCDLPDCPLYQLLGGKPSQHLQEAKAASPVFHVSFDDPPLLILHGTEDYSLVRPYQGRFLFDSYARARLDVEFHLIKGAGHGGPAYADESQTSTILRLLERTIRDRANSRLPRSTPDSPR